jgi:crotonyl-CoA carboxylase/reductase
VVEPGDVVLVWGAAGGLGSMGLQVAKAMGGRPIAVVSDDAKRRFCLDHGAVGVINRNEFSHWGAMPGTESAGYGEWAKGARAFGKAIWDAVGERVNPRIVFEHPGEATLPTSAFVAASGGMVVICAGTTGFNVTMDLRYHWMRQKRFQGSHLMNDEQATAANDLVGERRIDPAMSQVFAFDEIPEAHQLMYENRHPSGNMAVLVNATGPGEGAG